MKKNLLRKVWVVMAMVMSMTALTACNKKLKVTYDCTASDYIKLGQYKGIAVEYNEAEVRKQIIDARVQSDLDSLTTYNEVSREAQDEDQVTVTFTGTIGGQTIDGFCSEDYSLVLGTDTFAIDGFTDAIYGLKTGDIKVVTLTVPEQFSDATEYQGRKIVFNITVNKVEAPVAPMITDAYVKENFSYNTVEEYRAGLEAELEENIQEQLYDKKYEAAMVELQANTEVLGYPEDVLAAKKEELTSSLQFYSSMYGMTNDEYCDDRYGMSFDDFAKKTVIQQLIFQQIVVEENITIDEYYYKGELASFAADRGYSNSDTFVEKFGKDLIVKNMLVQKAVDIVMENAVSK